MTLFGIAKATELIIGFLLAKEREIKLKEFPSKNLNYISSITIKENNNVHCSHFELMTTYIHLSY